LAKSTGHLPFYSTLVERVEPRRDALAQYHQLADFYRTNGDLLGAGKFTGLSGNLEEVEMGIQIGKKLKKLIL
jgi:hypothetical protein